MDNKPAESWCEVPITVNSAKLRRETHHGRQWLIAPLSMIVDGVLNGSRGPGYYPPNETKATLKAWDGVPITVNHPFDPVTGNSLSAGDDGVLNRQGIGTVLNPSWSDRLVAEGWFDDELTQQRASTVHSDLIAGRPIELSTGLRTRNDPTAGVHNGVPYTWIARDHKPDHLAVLVGQTGACSRQMGCGVNNADKPVDNARMCWGRPCPTSDSPASFDEFVKEAEAMTPGKLKKAFEKVDKAHRAAMDEEWEKQGSQTGAGDLLKAAGETSKLGQLSRQRSALKYHAERNGFALNNADTKKQLTLLQRLSDLLGLTDNAGKFGNPQSKETGLFKRLGSGTGKGETHDAAQRGAIVLTDRDKELGATLVDGVTPAWAADEAQWLKARTEADKGNYPKDVYGSIAAHIYGHLGGKITTNQQPTEDLVMSREQLVNDLVTNCECWKGGAATLNTLTDEQLKKLKANADLQRSLVDATNQLRQAVGAPADLTLNAMPAFIKAKIDAKKGKDDDEDKPKKKKTHNKSAACDEDSDEYDEEECAATENSKGKKFVSITERLNPEELQTWNAAVEIEAGARQNLVSQLVANIADAATKQRLVTTLNAKSVPELRDLLLLQPAPTTNRQQQQTPVNPMAVFFGANAGGQPTHNSRQVDDAKDDVLDLPTMNFAEIAAEQKRKQA